MVKAKKYIVKNRFQGVPKQSDFEMVEKELPPLQEGEFLAKAEYISVDPCMRIMNVLSQVPYDQFGYQVGRVIQSKNAEYPVGCRVVSFEGWSDHIIVNPSTWKPRDNLYGLDTLYKLPELDGLSPSLGVGAVGMPGATAYFGLLELCKPKAGETLVVSGAAGAVGSLVGQIGKIKGCRVIGFAGSDDKVNWLTKELGFDKAYNYNTTDIAAALREAAPKGVDCYFDNVGGEFSSTVIAHMNHFGRVAACGAISAYNGSEIPKTTSVLFYAFIKQLKIEGLNVSDWMDRWPEAFKHLVQWIKSGQIVANEHVTEGFDKLYDAFVGMLAGDNKGKAVVKV